jgi:hypothetical protein
MGPLGGRVRQTTQPSPPQYHQCKCVDTAVVVLVDDIDEHPQAITAMMALTNPFESPFLTIVVILPGN